LILRETGLAGAWIVEPQPLEDARGFFARTYCAETFAAQGLDPRIDQISISFNRRAGTLRGLHLQRPPHAESKLVRVTAGAIFDVIVDVRAGSPTFGRWVGFELTAGNRRQLYIPPGLAHGFQTLVDGTEVVYQISTPYEPAAQAGIRWDDPDLAIAWPDPENAIMSERDGQLPWFADFEAVTLTA
jgi:dTDP-4-dehydrorhamnose 3,5-epimerase